MKFNKKFGLRGLLVITAILGLLSSACSPSAHAAETFQPNYYKDVLTNGTTTCVSNATLTTAITTYPFTVRPGYGLSVFPYYVGTNTSVANVMLDGELSYNGTSYTTTTPVKLTNTLNSTTAKRPVFFISKDQLEGVRTIKFTQIRTDHTNSIIFSNIVVSVPNQ